MRSSLIIITFFVLLFSCSVGHKRADDYIYPESNPYPKIFKTILHSEYGELLKTDLETSSLSFDCTQRNDQPYYWCGIDGELVTKKSGLPSRLETIFHVQLPEWAVSNVTQMIKTIKKRSQKLTVIIHRNPQVDVKKNAFWNQLFLFYDNRSCIAFLDTESLCPKSAKVENIYLK